MRYLLFIELVNSTACLRLFSKKATRFLGWLVLIDSGESGVYTFYNRGPFIAVGRDAEHYDCVVERDVEI